ncbi:hypothetical protein AAHA92_22081 [Salvia divinorum]|uniref:Uncharacterized protein n=1 Tax=Salvia divinorum TaxID=28513 RepID=A0ABD1GMK0_SALDI
MNELVNYIAPQLTVPPFLLHSIEKTTFSFVALPLFILFTYIYINSLADSIENAIAEISFSISSARILESKLENFTNQTSIS